MSELLCYAACSFGLESTVANELKWMGIEDVTVKDARVYFECDKAGLARANIRLASADRVYIVLKEFEAHTFDELFEGIKAMRWGDILPKDARMPVNADSVRSDLKSVPDIQSISKKAIVTAMSATYKTNFFKEEGEEYPIYITILKDTVSVCLNASGLGLNRRGYRIRNGAAPIRETLAAGIIRLARYRYGRFYDVMCGSGTIPIEAAMRAANISPGLSREFASEKWSGLYRTTYRLERESARADIIKSPDAEIFASDIDPKMVDMAKFHARRAGVLEMINFRCADARDFHSAGAGILVSNPPYAMRMGEESEVRELYRAMGQCMKKFPEVKCFYICADDAFESFYGRKPDKKRKLYNGNIRSDFYQYFR